MKLKFFEIGVDTKSSKKWRWKERKRDVLLYEIFFRNKIINTDVIYNSNDIQYLKSLGNEKSNNNCNYNCKNNCKINCNNNNGNSNNNCNCNYNNSMRGDQESVGQSLTVNR